jgi:glycerol-3-phosphate dehydrogenase
MAQDVIDLAGKELHKEVRESTTDRLPIVGADGYNALVQQVPLISAETHLSESTVVHLLNRYGSLMSEILQLIAQDSSLSKPLGGGLPYLRAEIHYAVSHEGARSVEDVVARRTRISFEAEENGAALLEDIADIIAPLLDWNRKQRAESIAQYRMVLERERAEARRLLTSETAASS